MSAAPSAQLATLRLEAARNIAEGCKLLGAEGVYWRLCAALSPHELVDFSHAERERGTAAEHLMEGAAIHLAAQAFNIAMQTDHPELVCQLMVKAFAMQLGMQLARRDVGVSVNDDGTQQSFTIADLLRKEGT